MPIRTETIHDINNIVDIALLTYTGNVIYIEPHIFKTYCTNIYNSKDDNSDLGCRGDEYIAYNSYFIANSTDKYNNGIALSELTNSSNRLKDYLKEGESFTTGSGASHNNSSKSLFNGCTQFYVLRNLNDSFLTNKGFVKFNGIQEYLSWPRRDSWDWYWRVYYRTIDDFMIYKNCGPNNLLIDNYNNNNFSCKYYIDDNRINILSKTCAEKTLNDNQLWNICQPLLFSNNVNNTEKRQINQKVIDYCSQSNRLITDKLCKDLWNLSYNSYYTQNDKASKIDPVARNLCKPGHNNYPFCYCITNEKYPLEYYNDKGEKKQIDPSCVANYCNEEAYKLSDHNEKKCPNVCIQTVIGSYATIKGVDQKCAVNTDTSQTTNPDTNSDTNPDTNPDTSQTKNLDKDEIKKVSLFGIQNDNIKKLMANTNTTFPKEWNNYLLTEEDIFFLFIIFLIIAILILPKIFGSKKNNQYYDSSQRYYDNGERYYDNGERYYDNGDQYYDNGDQYYDNRDQYYDNRDQYYDNRYNRR